GQWQCYFNLGGKQVFRAGGETEQEAWKQLRRYQKQVAKGDYTTPDQERMTIGDLLDGYAKHLERKGAKSPTHASLMAGLRKHLGMERALDSKIHQRIDAFVTGLRKSLANASINRYLQALRAAYRVALKRRAIPWVPHFELLKEDNVRTGF